LGLLNPKEAGETDRYRGGKSLFAASGNYGYDRTEIRNP